MDQIEILDEIERYLRNEMSEGEKAAFEERRNEIPDLDQMVVEHSILMQKLNRYGKRKNFRAALNDLHSELSNRRVIRDPEKTGLVLTLWKKHKRVMAVAASIAGITTLIVAGMVSYYSGKANSQYVLELNRKVEYTKRTVDALKQQVESETIRKAPNNIPIKSGGTGFMIDTRGILITNAHVVKNANTVVVQNNKGQEFRAKILHLNAVTDIAILQVEDQDFKPLSALPYNIKRTGAELGEPLFTLGFPREEIVYNEGYMSAKTGFKGDTISFQIGVAANPGNSGGPVFNKNGEVIGIINTRQEQAEGVVFAISANNIFESLVEIEADSIASKLKKSSVSNLRGLDRVQQIKKIEDCVFMVKSY